MRKGFTLIELLVVMVIIGILISMAVPNYIKAKDRARETQVQSRLHTIRTALERYAVDNDGNYPYWLLGGDWSDWDVSQYAPVYCPNLPQPCADGDALIMYGYLAHYPQNVFVRRGLFTGTQFHVFDCPKPCLRRNPDGTCARRTYAYCDYNRTNQFPRQYREACDPTGQSDGTCRRVGGDLGDLMWDVSEGFYGDFSFSPYSDPIISPPNNWQVTYRGWHGHPPFGPLPTKQESPQFYRTPNRYLHPFLMGNFYYYPILQYGFSVLAGVGEPVRGYHLAGYGAIWNRGWDVYDEFGDYMDGAGGHCELYIEPTGYGDCKATLEDPYVSSSSFYRQVYCYNNGPDGQQDGVIMVLSGGTDVKVLKNTRKPLCEGVR
ncbi:MAG: type II secretion system protein [bacterium JZ-2024 1]